MKKHPSVCWIQTDAFRCASLEIILLVVLVLGVLFLFVLLAVLVVFVLLILLVVLVLLFVLIGHFKFHLVNKCISTKYSVMMYRYFV